MWKYIAALALVVGTCAAMASSKVGCESSPQIIVLCPPTDDYEDVDSLRLELSQLEPRSTLAERDRNLIELLSGLEARCGAA